MFEWLTKFNKILVTGPQRSGTRICAKMIAQDTGYEYIDEIDYGMDSLYWFYSFIGTKGQRVIQCPVLCRHVHTFSAEDTVIVFMRRKVEDIIASQKRIRWSWEWLELARYDQSEGVISQVKYDFWDKFQKLRIQNAFEVDYETLAQHPLWVSQNSRHGFDPEQTSAPDVTLKTDPNVYLIPISDVFYWDRSDLQMAFLAKTRHPVKTLNETGHLIWKLCDGTRTRAEILKLLTEQFEDVAEPTLAHDLDIFISDLVIRGFLRLAQSPVYRNRSNQYE